MKTKIATSIEQSKKLLELGLNADTADMWYLPIKDTYELVTTPSLTRGIIPAWSLSKLLELMPEIGFVNKPILDLNGIEMIYSDIHFTKGYNEPIDAAYEMICWLLENKYI